MSSINGQSRQQILAFVNILNIQINYNIVLQTIFKEFRPFKPVLVKYSNSSLFIDPRSLDEFPLDLCIQRTNKSMQFHRDSTRLLHSRIPLRENRNTSRSTDISQRNKRATKLPAIYFHQKVSRKREVHA